MQLEEIGKKAKEAESVMRVLDTNTKNEVLQKAAENLKKDKEKILSAMRSIWKTAEKRECQTVCWIVFC